MDPITLVVVGAVSLVGILVAAVKKSGSTTNDSSSSSSGHDHPSDKVNNRGGPGPRGGK